MNAVKTLAIGALVIGAAVQVASAGPFSSNFTWTAWNAGTGAVQASGNSDPFNLTTLNYPITTNPSSSVPVVIPASLPVSAPVQPVSAPNPTPSPIPTSTLLPTSSGSDNTPNTTPTPQPTTQTQVASTPVFADPTPAPVAATVPTAPVPAPAPSSHTTYDAFINLGASGFPNAASLTASTPQAWYNSSAITGLFGGTPTAQQEAAFDSAVVQHVESTFQLAGVHVNLTTDPNAQAAHTLSVVSNTQSAWGPLLGLTNIGGNGFDFIDNAAQYATSVDQLAWIVAHNVSHELMLAFGVGENYDKTGNFIDAETANLSMMLNPNATFSQSAAAALIASGSLSSPLATGGAYAQQVGPQPVPEPTTIALWSAAALVGIVIHRRRQACRSTLSN